MKSTDPCSDPGCRHRRDRHLDQEQDPKAVRAGGAHPCRDCLGCRGFIEEGVGLR